MRARLTLAAGLGLALLALPPALPAQTELPKKELQEKTTEGLGKLRPLVDGKDYAGALALVDALLPAAKPGSFDLYVLSQIKAQLLLTQNQLGAAIAPLETSLRLAEENPNFFDPSANAEQLYLLAQLHYQQAAEAKGPAAQKPAYEKALGYIQRWLERAPKITADARLFAASLFYQLGTLDSAKLDRARLQQSIEQAREGLLLAVTPSTQLYQILVACHMQLGQNAEAAELLELLALRDPKNGSTWSQLQSLYLAQAGDAKDPDQARAQNLRALHVLDRAQTQGQLGTPRDHYTRVALLFNLGQYARAARLLEDGLADGRIENQKRNWELLASAYQQTNEDKKAVDAMTRAAAKFPDDAALEFSLAQFLYNTGQLEPAYRRAESALKKGFDKPGQAEVYLAYLAFELQRYDDAKKWVDSARTRGDVPATTLDPLGQAITDAIRQRS